MIGIYKITSPTKKIYIGQSVNIEKRIEKYKGAHCKSQPILYSSLKKYGWINHKLEILCSCEISELNDKERYYQDLHNAMSVNGLNCRLTTTKDKSGLSSEQTKAKQRISMKGLLLGKKQSREQIEKRIKSLTGKKRTKEHKIHSSNIKLGYLNPMFGKKVKESSKDLQREKLSGEFNYLTKIILNVETGVFYYGLNEASKSININKGVLWSKMVRSKVNKTSFIYV